MEEGESGVIVAEQTNRLKHKHPLPIIVFVFVFVGDLERGVVLGFRDQKEGSDVALLLLTVDKAAIAIAIAEREVVGCGGETARAKPSYTP